MENIVSEEMIRTQGKCLVEPSEPKYNDGNDNELRNLLIYELEMVDDRYRVLDVLGKGTYGIVYRCLDVDEDQFVAVKILRNEPAFLNSIKKNNFPEMNLLLELNEKYGEMAPFVRLLDSTSYKNHIVLVFEFLGPNLYEVIKSRSYTGLPLEIISFIGRQLVLSVKYLNDTGIIHRDYKPENILLHDEQLWSTQFSPASERRRLRMGGKTFIDNEMQNYCIKLVDFGSSLKKNEVENLFVSSKVYRTQKSSPFYFMSRYYRSPEVLLGVPYNEQVDLWSVAALLGELCIGIPLFPGYSTYDLANRFQDVLGPPPLELLRKGMYSHHYFTMKGTPKKVQILSEDEHCQLTGNIRKGDGPIGNYGLRLRELIIKGLSLRYVKGKGYVVEIGAKKEDISAMSNLEAKKEMIRREIEDDWRLKLADFLDRILKWDPKERMTVEEAMNHPFVKIQDVDEDDDDDDEEEEDEGEY